ncbi:MULTISPECIES: hypothetical protein [Nitrosomonas]|uniref:Uncharacterized protein n=1 Tax=Nitrosomonas communis TaxID=44574 RepID=A0A0F7KCN7_9PROT|nr:MULTISPECIES: hypothetical protein [Nitrosomonas]AKH37331.1 hypothetical protein AAW31_05155 [Nitrosomonas communis]TYP72333.1 hypothetical protein BCL69_11057 [Nitrosomonas communis]UVS62549.1 hypothetical protein NX761_05350 [Nitrosomonas sp. PLL12]
MNKNLKDILVHSAVSLVMMIILLVLPHLIAVTVAVVVSWYMWELGQRIAKDNEYRGLIYWWNLERWNDQARLEFLVPSVVAIVAINIYVIITL